MLEISEKTVKKSKLRIGIIGAGEGASWLLDIFKDNPEVEVGGLAFRRRDREAVAEAQNMGVVLYDDFRELAEAGDIDMIIDATGNPDVEKYLYTSKKSKSQLLSPLGTWLMWRLVDEHKIRQREIAQSLAEREVLYSAGVMLASAANTSQTLEMIMESALNITGMTAGSLALYDEEKGVMQIKAAIGFEAGSLPENYTWKVRPGGLTSYILSNNNPTVINDLDEQNSFDAGPLSEIGVRSLIATPLKVSGKIVGILYVDDFVPRKFTDREINILNLLALQAAAAIDKALLLERAEFMATTDGLTKLFNHRHFVRSLEREVKRADRYGYPVSLLMIDVDHFKIFNDTFGHLQGNVVLTTLANILRQSARETDMVARYGGEEFAIILSQADREHAAQIAERIRGEVEEAYFPGEDKQPLGRVTISIGVAGYPEDARSSMELVDKSDRALYLSKERGRNRVTDFSEVK